MYPKLKYDKKTLRIIMGLTESTFYRKMKSIENDPEYIKLFPRHNKFDRILFPKEFKWILKSYPIDDNQIIESFVYLFDLDKAEIYHVVRVLDLETNPSDIIKRIGEIKGF